MNTAVVQFSMVSTRLESSCTIVRAVKNPLKIERRAKPTRHVTRAISCRYIGGLSRRIGRYLQDSAAYRIAHRVEVLVSHRLADEAGHRVVIGGDYVLPQHNGQPA